ncbi:hypothetical protein ACFE04_029213 [Oxalis oulophora]
MEAYDRENIILNKEYKHPDHPRFYCECDSGVISVLMTAYDRANIGRRYYACGNIFEGLDCGFHQWYDRREIVSPYIVDLVRTLNGAYSRAECELMVSSDDNMKLEQRIKLLEERIKLLEESTRRKSENFDILNESHRRLEFENLELSNEIATQRQIVKQLTEEKQKIIEDAAKVEFKVTIERIAQ